MDKVYKNVREMVKDMPADDAFKKETLELLAKKGLSKLLFSLRCSKGLTQKQLAEKIGCKQARISKIEHAFNENISVKDLTDYGRALDLRLLIGFEDTKATIADRIKFHAFMIKKLLDTLVELGKDDEALKQGVKQFLGEYYYNMTNMFLDSASKLPDVQVSKEEIHINPMVKVEEKTEEQKQELCQK